MKKRSFISGLFVGIIIASSITAFAADFIQATLYPIKLIINGEEQKIPEEEYSILNYNDHTYVPLRFISENIGAKVGFIEASSHEDTIVTIDFNNHIGDQKNSLLINDNFLSAAKQGKLNGIEIPLGTSKQDLLNILGEPDEIGKVTAPYLKYADTTFYLKDDVVNVIDVKIELPTDKIKELLGTPDLDGISDAGTTEYIVGYDVDPYYLFFRYSSKEAETGRLTFKNPRG
ncbi:MAG: stalk domain-containing protein [Dethiobacteria bacterium]|mgnify:CR=1 FL=1